MILIIFYIFPLIQQLLFRVAILTKLFYIVYLSKLYSKKMKK